MRHLSKGVTPTTELSAHLIDSNRLSAAKFLVLNFSKPDKFLNCTEEEYLISRDCYLEKLFKDFDLKIPVFINTNYLDQSKIPADFTASLDLSKALAPATAVAEPATSGGHGVVASL